MGKITSKQAFGAILVIGLAVLALLYFKVYKNYNEKTEKLTKENAQLEKQVATLKEYYDNINNYRDKMDEMTVSMKEIIAKYPSDAREEDVIATAKSAETLFPVAVTGIQMAKSESVYEVPAEALENLPEGVLGDEKLTDLAKDGSANLGTARAEIAKDILDAIEYDAENKTVSTVKTPLTFVKKPVTYTMGLDYPTLKNVIKMMNDSTNRVSIDLISLVRDDDKGNLSGSMNVSFYSLIGSGKEYTAPQIAKPEVGTQNPF